MGCTTVMEQWLSMVRKAEIEGRRARILDGSAAAKAIKEDLTQRVAALAEQRVRPGLGTVLVGDDPGSRTYVNGKHRDCAEVGIASLREDLPADATQEDVEAAVERLNANPSCHGFIVQLPLPRGLDEHRVLQLIEPTKDADGLHPMNLGTLVLGTSGEITTPLPCTPRGCIELMERNGISLDGLDVCVVGRGLTVGRSIGLLLTRRQINATVTLCHTGTRDLGAHTRRADVVVAAAGVPGLVTADMVKPGAVVLDVGVSRISLDDGSSRLAGDIAADVADVADWISPNPGGVGPMTRALLLTNVVEAAERASRAAATF